MAATPTTWRQEAQESARRMRAAGKSYEQIADELSGHAHGSRPRPIRKYAR